MDSDGKPSKTKFLIMGVAAVALIGGGVAAFALRGKPPEPVPVPKVEDPVAVAPVVEAPVQPQAPAAPAPAQTVKVISDPEGAEVWKGTELLGNTPLDVPKPDGAAKLELQLRKFGYAERDFTISAATLGSEVRFTLRKDAQRTARKPSGGGAKPAAAPSAPASGGKKKGPGSEVIDPWN